MPLGGVYITTPQVRLLHGVEGESSGALATATAALAVSLHNSGDSSTSPTTLRATFRLHATGRLGQRAQAGVATSPPIETQMAVPGVSANSTIRLDMRVSLGKVLTWSPAQPALYTACLCLGSGCDTNCTIATVHRTIFGIRTFDFSTARGLVLNGLPIKLRGGCVHHDNGPLGSRAIARAEARRVQLLKSSGYNAIRNRTPASSVPLACAPTHASGQAAAHAAGAPYLTWHVLSLALCACCRRYAHGRV